MSGKVLGMFSVVMAIIVGAMPAPAQTACDRACLRTMLDQYLAAVVKHDRTAAPLVVGFRQTENAINVRPGNGVWKTVTGLGKVQRRYLDPVSGQAAYYGTVEEGSGTAVVTVRVRVENRQLTEADRPSPSSLPEDSRRPRRAEATTASGACRTSISRWLSREGFRSWTRRPRWSSPLPCLSAGPDRRHPVTHSANGS